MKGRKGIGIVAAALVFLVSAVSALSAGVAADFFVYLPVALRAEAPPTPTATATIATPVVPTVTPSATPSSTPQATVGPTVQPTATDQPAPGGCNICSYDAYNCSDFNTQAQAQACFDYCWAQVGYDVHRLDSDDDGEACESLP